MASGTRSSNKKKTTPASDKKIIGQGQKTEDIPANAGILKILLRVESKMEERDKMYFEMFKDVSETFSSLTDTINQQSTRIKAMEDYLANLELEPMFESLDTTLASLIRSQEKMVTTLNTNIASHLELQKSVEPKIKDIALRFSQKEREEKLMLEAEKLKHVTSLDWANQLKERKKRYWNFKMNWNKAKLYKTWREDTPKFIPRKFRPKVTNNEDPLITQLRIDEAQQRYINNISAMDIFSQKHKHVLLNIDSEMIVRIDELGVDPEYKDRLKSIWEENTRLEQEKSDRIWEQKESFLKKKKHSEIQSGNFQTCTKSWEEVMQERNTKFKYKPDRSSKRTDQRVQDVKHSRPNPLSQNIEYNIEQPANADFLE